MITYKKGNALSIENIIGAKIIAHICNDIGKWGSGFVVPLSKKFPKSEREYRSWHKCDILYNKEFKLGNMILVKVTDNIYVANMIAQHDIRWKNNIAPIRYNDLRKCLNELNKHAISLNASIHMPRIGAARAGGSWNEIESIINDELKTDITVYDFGKRDWND